MKITVSSKDRHVAHAVCRARVARGTGKGAGIIHNIWVRRQLIQFTVLRKSSRCLLIKMNEDLVYFIVCVCFLCDKSKYLLEVNAKYNQGKIKSSKRRKANR